MITAAQWGVGLGAPVVALATPMRDADDRVTGALMGVVHQSRRNFLDRASRSRCGRTGGRVLAAAQGNPVAAWVPMSQLPTQEAFQLMRLIDNVPARVFWKATARRCLGINAAFAHDAGKHDPAQVIGTPDHEPA